MGKKDRNNNSGNSSNSFTYQNIISNSELLIYLFEDDVANDDFSCKICFDLYFGKKIYSCKNGHAACEDCWSKSLKTKKECMLCREKYGSMGELFKMTVLENILDNMKLKCPYSLKPKSTNDVVVDNSQLYQESNDPDGCKELIKYGDLKTHFSECQYRFVICELEGCKIPYRFNESNVHSNACLSIKIDCKLCGQSVSRKKMESHLGSLCQLNEAKCLQCNEMVIRKSMDYHIREKCQQTTISCKYHEYGCSFKMKRIDLGNHLLEHDHLKYLSRIESLNQQIKIRDDIISKLHDRNNCLIVSFNEKINLVSKLVKDVEKCNSSIGSLKSRLDTLSKQSTKVDDSQPCDLKKDIYVLQTHLHIIQQQQNEINNSLKNHNGEEFAIAGEVCSFWFIENVSRVKLIYEPQFTKIGSHKYYLGFDSIYGLYLNIDNDDSSNIKFSIKLEFSDNQQYLEKSSSTVSNCGTKKIINFQDINPTFIQTNIDRLTNNDTLTIKYHIVIYKDNK